MCKPKVVVFDLGKVLLDFDYAKATSKMAPFCSVPETELHRIINQSPLLHRYETGLISTSDFFSEIQKLSSFCHDFHQFEPLFGDIFSPIPEMIELNRSLRSQRIFTAIFSNTNEMAVRHITRSYSFFREFDHYIYSFQHRFMKPAAEIYRIVESTVNASGPEILYIDDRLENVQTGEKIGWQTLHHTSPTTTIPIVQKLTRG